MQTAKSIQLTDGNNVNISPMTDLMSVYYEVQTDDNIVARKYIYNDFPAGIVLTNTSINNMQGIQSQSEILDLENNQKLQYVDNDGAHDISVSNVITKNLSGTNYNVLVSDTYNLSEILFHYESKHAFNSSYIEVSTYADTLSNGCINYLRNVESLVDASIKIQDTSINIHKQQINTLDNTITTIQQTYYDNKIWDYSDLSAIVSSNALVSGKIYPVSYKPSNANFNITGQSQTLTMLNDNYDHYILYLKAVTPNTFDKRICNISAVDNSNNVTEMHWQAEFDFGNDKMTWLRDEFGNEAPYDFKHLTMKVNGVDTYTFSDNAGNDMSLSGNAYGNIVKKNIACTYMPVFRANSSIYDNRCDIDGEILINADNIYGNNIVNSSFISSFTVNAAANDDISYIDITDSSIYVIQQNGYTNSFNMVKSVNSSICVDKGGVNIGACNIYNSILKTGIFLNQYELSNMDIYNSSLFTGSNSVIQNSVFLDIDNAQGGSMQPNIFIANTNICASTFNVI